MKIFEKFPNTSVHVEQKHLRHKTFLTKQLPKIWYFWGNYALNYNAKANTLSVKMLCDTKNVPIQESVVVVI